MAQLYIPAAEEKVADAQEIQRFLNDRGIDYEVWRADFEFDANANQETVLEAYQYRISPLMKEKGYKSADVISVHPQMEKLQALREKFLSEHTHSEDEVRFFVEGEGQFWFHLENGPKGEEIFQVVCRAGDFLSVPAGYKHWFDLAPKYTVKAIRIFTSPEGWVANYTGSGVEDDYIQK